MSNHCLVCGSQNTGKKYIINQLITNTQFKRINTNHYECTWKILNKYYQSDVTLTIINSIDLIAPNQINDDNDFNNQQTNSNKINLSQFQAIILVLNLNQPHSLIQKDLDAWLNVLSPQLQSSECSLLMGNYTNSYSSMDTPINQTKQKEYHQYLHNFGVDNYFEFVPSPFDINDNSDEKTNENDFFGYNSQLFSTYDSQELGYNRINSALQCVMWPNMTRNTPNKSQAYTKTQPLLSNATQVKYVNDNEEKVKEQKINENMESDTFKKGNKVILKGLKSKANWNDKIAIIVGAFSKSKQRWPVELELMENNEIVIKKALIKTVNLVLYKEKKEIKEVIDEEKVNEENENEQDPNKEIENKEFVEKMLWNAKSNLNSENKENNSEKSLESKMNSFQSLMDEMQQVRKEAKSGKLTDDERRQRAADTAMKLISYMGLDEDKDKDGDDADQNDD